MHFPEANAIPANSPQLNSNENSSPATDGAGSGNFTRLDPWQTLPDAWRTALRTRLAPGENLVAWFEADLDGQLRYSRQLLVLTNQRLLGIYPTGGEFAGDKTVEKGWALQEEARQATSAARETNSKDTLLLKVSEQGSIGQLELFGPAGRLAHWRFTAGCVPSARALVQKWETARTGVSPMTSVCPSCGSPINPDETTTSFCPACNPIRERHSFSALLRLVAFARPRAGMIALGFLLTVASTAASLVPPYLTMPLLDDVLIPHQNGKQVDFSLVGWYLLGLLGAAVAAWLLDWIRSYVSAWVSERISSDLRQRTYAHLQRLSLEFFGGKRTGDLMSRISNDSDQLCNFLSAHLVDFATDILMIIMAAALLLTIDPWLALTTLLPFPLIVWLVNWARSRLLRGYHQGSIAWANMISILADTIPGIRVVKAFAQESREIDRFAHSNDQVLRANDRVNSTWAFFGPVVTFLTTLGLLVVWMFAAWRVYNGQITVGVLTAFLAYIARFYGRSESMIRIFSFTQRAAASAHRIFEILDRVPNVPEPVTPIDPGRLAGGIELQGVRFKYGTREVLHGIDLKIQPGEMIGLVGPSGAGKSTLINLICRFIDVAEGAILVDGTDIRSFPIEAYRKNIGIVLQDPFLFYGTVAENIAYGKPGVSREEIIAAARAARAHEFILRFADGYDSLVGERGQSLSGGERQRISIARALLIDPSILILDEATSSVDTQTEQEIQAALETLTRGRTTIAIAHRLSTLRRANRIVVLDRGVIVEVGTHQELLQAEGRYAALVYAQGGPIRQEKQEGNKEGSSSESQVRMSATRTGLADLMIRNGHTKPHFQLHYDSWGRLVLTDDCGRQSVGVEPIRAFPITAPERGISICNAEGQEVLWINELEDVPAEVRPMLEDELIRRHFLPVIEKVINVVGDVEPTQWEVQTNRGKTTFTLKSEEDVRRLSSSANFTEMGHRSLIVDAFGIRYLIPDLRALDGASRRFLERYV